MLELLVLGIVLLLTVRACPLDARPTSPSPPRPHIPSTACGLGGGDDTPQPSGPRPDDPVWAPSAKTRPAALPGDLGPRADVAAIREQLLRNSPNCFGRLEFSCDDLTRTVTVRGELPTYYFRQLVLAKLLNLGSHAVRDETVVTRH